MKLPARLLLAVLTLSIGSLTPIGSPQRALTNSQTSDRCVMTNTRTCHSCPTSMDGTPTPGSSCCMTQLGCCALYLTRTTPVLADIPLIGTVNLDDERAMARTQRPLIPPPRGGLS